MKIKEVMIKNYRSLQDILIQDVGSLSTFIGSNSSGKSNLFEAIWLFFSELDPALERSIGAADEYLWFDRDSNRDISFRIGFEVEKQELESIIPEEIASDLRSDSATFVITIVRVLKGPHSSAKWQTLEISLDGNKLIKDGKFIYKRSGKVKKEETVPPAAQKATPPADYLGVILQGISKYFKGKFKLIPAARNVTGQGGLAGRTSLMSPTLLGELIKLGQAVGTRPDEIRWITIQESVKITSRDIADLRIMSNQVTIREEGSDMHFPVSLIGGGYQEMLGLIYEIGKDDTPCVAVEEPELHLHPEIARKIFDFLKTESKKRQLFISTHSPVFIDQEDLGNTWVIRKERKSTTASRIKEPEELKSILFELGIRPSDIFFSDALIFVEGLSDKIVFPHWFRKLGVEFGRYRAAMIPTHGKAKGKYHLDVWLEVVKNVNISFFMIFDKGAEREARESMRKKILTPGENLFLLKEGSLEDYYEPEKLVDAIASEYKVDISEEEKKQLLKKPRAKSISDFLKKKNIDSRGWKVRIGEKVASSMTAEELPEEIKRIIERIGTNLRLTKRLIES